MKNMIPWKKAKNNILSDWWNDDWLFNVWENPFRNLPLPFVKSFAGPTPSVDISEDEKEYTVKAELPGMSEKDIEVTWHDGLLRIKGEKKAEKEEKKKGTYYRECSYGSFVRDISLEDVADWKDIEAKYKNGVLTVKVPKTKRDKKEIKVKVE